MTTFTLPATRAFAAAAAEFGLQSNTFVSRSPLNGSVQTVGVPGGFWVCTYTFGFHNRADRAEIEGFLAGLMGQEHRVSMSHPNPFRRVPRGTLRGAPTVQATVSALASSIAISTPNIGDTLERGDLFQIGNQLYMATASAVSNGSKVMTVSVAPRARATHAISAAVTWSSPVATFMLSQDSFIAPWQPGMSPQFSVQFIETLL